jgi:GMP synthase (glutamine-hydrolysing)
MLILDYGSQYTLLIARKLREIGVYSEIIDGMSDGPPDDFAFDGLILSGGPDTVGESGARSLPGWVLKGAKPVLGICYGMQLLVEALGGKLRSSTLREFGHATLHLAENGQEKGWRMFDKVPRDQVVWMSHGDDVEAGTSEFLVAGHSDSGCVAAVIHKDRPLIGLQFHPEVQHSAHGHDLLKGFVVGLCAAPLNWRASSMLDAALAQVKETVGEGSGKVLMAISGGVDSTVAAALVSRALGPYRVEAVFVDTGLMRKDEVPWVAENLRRMGARLRVIESGPRFLKALEGIEDPEAKRKIIGRLFVEDFEHYAETHKGFTHLGQGTLYPDVIESAGHGAGAKVIKSHHNVGGLPERLKLALLEPFRYFFKDEVRTVGEALGIDHDLVHRHPFPGPGLAVRILGAISEEKVKILQEADHVFIEALRREDLYHKVWQAFAVLLPVKSVGVMGDNRTYQWTCALRAVVATDGMTASVGDLPMPFLVSVAAEIVRKVHGINRVVYDITTKPPATIEWE